MIFNKAIFPSAKEARRLSFNRMRLHVEVRSIEEHILNAINQGNITVSIDDTLMTSSSNAPTAEDYYDVWKNTKNDKVLENEMKTVIEYFNNLGYSITRNTNSNTNNTFIWNVQW